MSKTLRVMLVNNYAGRGGIPRAVATLANSLATRGHEIVVMSQKPVPALFYPFYRLCHKINVLSLPPGKRAALPLGKDWLPDIYPLDPAVTVIPFSFSDNNLKIQALRKKVMAIDPDVCVCPLPDGSHLPWAITLMGSGIPYVYSERTSPRAIEEIFWTRKGRLAAMSGADAIHLLLPSYQESIPDFLHDRIAIIPNAVTIPEKMADTKGAKRKVFLWMGRLYEEAKQCRFALDAFALLAKKFPDWDFVIAGNGPDERDTKAHAKKLGLEGRIKFLGEIAETFYILSSSQAFCFSSRIEGMPNVLLEAMAAGLPCVAFSECDGIKSIVKHGENGLLAAEMRADSLAVQMERLMEDPTLRERVGQAARASMTEFSALNVTDAWEKLLIKTAARKGHTVMDTFREEPFASRARLSSRARQEWALRDFGYPMPDSLEHKMLAILDIVAKRVIGIMRRLSRSNQR